MASSGKIRSLSGKSYTNLYDVNTTWCFEIYLWIYTSHRYNVISWYQIQVPMTSRSGKHLTTNVSTMKKKMLTQDLHLPLKKSAGTSKRKILTQILHLLPTRIVNFIKMMIPSQHHIAVQSSSAPLQTPQISHWMLHLIVKTQGVVWMKI